MSVTSTMNPPLPKNRGRVLLLEAVRLLSKLLIGGVLVGYTVFKLAGVFAPRQQSNTEVVRWTTPSCVGKSSKTFLNLNNDRQFIVVFSLGPDQTCQDATFKIELPADASAPDVAFVRDLAGTSASKSIVRKSGECNSETTANPNSYVTSITRVCHEFTVRFPQNSTVNIYMNASAALVQRTFSKSMLLFYIGDAQSNVELLLDSRFDVDNTNVKEFRSEADRVKRTMHFASFPGNEVVFFLTDLERAENRDRLILIYGALLGTGLALVAETLSSAVNWALNWRGRADHPSVRHELA